MICERPVALQQDCRLQCKRATKPGLRSLPATRRCSLRRTFRSRTLALAAPGINPGFNLLVRDAFSAIKRPHRLPDARHLPFVDVEIFAERLGCQKRSAAAGAPG